MKLGATGPRPPRQVWERYAVPADWPRWAPQIRRVEASAGRIAVGVTGRVWGWAGPAVRFTVTSVDEPRLRWSWEVHLGPVRLSLQHGVAAMPDGGSAAWLDLRGPLPAVLAYLPLAQLALRRLVH